MGSLPKYLALALVEWSSSRQILLLLLLLRLLHLARMIGERSSWRES